MDDIYSKLKHRAIDLLSRREHGERELLDKLLQKAPDGEDTHDIAQALIVELVEQGYVSDRRFAESTIRNKALQGQGPMKIRQALRQKRVPDDIIALALETVEIDWFENSVSLRQRKFGLGPVDDIKLKAKQQRFLQYKGFHFDHIQHAMNAEEDEWPE